MGIHKASRYAWASPARGTESSPQGWQPTPPPATLKTSNTCSNQNEGNPGQPDAPTEKAPPPTNAQTDAGKSKSAPHKQPPANLSAKPSTAKPEQKQYPKPRNTSTTSNPASKQTPPKPPSTTGQRTGSTPSPHSVSANKRSKATEATWNAGHTQPPQPPCPSPPRKAG